jgi:putative resolvase
LGVHPNTLRKWDREGKISVVRTVGGKRRIP